MIFSRYNYLFESSRFGYLLYNSLSNSFAELDEHLFTLLNSLKGNEYIQQMISEDILATLIDKKIFVENDEDEYYNLKFRTLSRRFDKSSLSLTIATTLACNFNCQYCYEEERPDIYMSDETSNNLIQFVNSFNTDIINICWYGGEPLLDFKRIESISKILIESGKKINAMMVTNGFLLNQEIASKLIDNHIKHLQITIDGLRNTHDDRRPHKETGKSFDEIIKNIDYLMNSQKGINVIIRCNIDSKNEDEFFKLLTFIKDRYNNPLIQVAPGFVENLGSCLENNSCYFDRKKISKFFINQYKRYKIENLSYYPHYGRNECMARHLNSYLIDAHGYIYKCWNDIGKIEKSLGNLNVKGIKNSNILIRYLTGADQLEDTKCRNCLLFPVCIGNCTYKRLENEFNESKIDLCDFRKGNLKEFLEIYYQIKKKHVEKEKI